MTNIDRAHCRVLWLIKNLQPGGAERLLEVMSRHVISRGMDIEVAYVTRGRGRLAEEISAHGVTVHALDAAHDLDLSWIVRLRRLVRDRKIRIVHSHSALTGAVARIAIPDRLAVHTYTEHNVWRAYHPMTRIINAATYWRNQRVFAVSRGVGDAIRYRTPLPGAPDIETLYHGFDGTQVRSGADARRYARALMGYDDDEFVIGTVANLRPEKNHKLLISSFASMLQMRPQLRLVLIGKGRLEQRLRTQVTELGISHRVDFTGLRDDVQVILPGFDVFVLSSNAEGLPISLLESMAAGLPSVATDVGGVPEVLIDAEQGFVVPPRDGAALMTAIEKLMDPELRSTMGASAMDRAALFELTRTVERLDAAYAELARGAPDDRSVHGR